MGTFDPSRYGRGGCTARPRRDTRLHGTFHWLGGGCGPFTAGTLGAIFKVTNGALVLVGSVKMSGFNYSYRADLT